MTEPMRLQKWLSQRGVLSRRVAEQAMRAGQLRINGTIATLGDKVTGDEKITLGGKQVGLKKVVPVVYAFHKPRGVQCTWRRFLGKQTLGDYRFPTRVFAVGRLDADSYGLLLLTNDGELAHRLMHPKFVHEKEYIVRIEGQFTAEQMANMRSGVMLPEESRKTARCKITAIGPSEYRFVLREGRNRQIRRMVEWAGSRVVDLQRVRVATVTQGQMKAGEWRALTPAETKELRDLVGVK